MRPHPLMRNEKTQAAIGFLVLLAFSLCLVSPANSQYIGNDPLFGVGRFYDKNHQFVACARGTAIQWFRGKKLLICPFHTIAPTQDDPPNISRKELWGRVVSGEIYNLVQDSVVATTGKTLLQGTQSIDDIKDDEWSRDLMAFDLVSNPHLPLVPLAPAATPVGTRVWVYFNADSEKTRQGEQFSAKVSESQPEWMAIKMDDHMPLGGSGCPVFNAKHELVGMLLGHQSEDRKEMSVLPSTAIYAKLWKEVPR